MVAGKVGSPLAKTSLRERMFFDRSHPVRSWIARWGVRLGIPAAAGLIAHAAIVPDLKLMAPFISNIDAQTMASIIIAVSTTALAGLKSVLVGRTPKQIIAPNAPVAVAVPSPAVPSPAAVPVVPLPAGLVAPAPAKAPAAAPPPPRRPAAPPLPVKPLASPVAPSVRELFEKGEFTQAIQGADLGNSDQKRICDEIVGRRAVFARVLTQIEQLKAEGKFTEAAKQLEGILNSGLLVSASQLPKLRAELARLRSNPREGTVNLTEEIDINEVGIMSTPEVFEATMLSQIPPAPISQLPPPPADPAAPPASAPAPSSPTVTPPAPQPAAGSQSGSTTIGSQMDLFITALKNDAIRQRLIAANNDKRAMKRIMESLSEEDIAGIESQFDAAYELVAKA